MSDEPRRPRSRWSRATLLALPVYWVVLFIATHAPHVRIPGEIPQSDKVVHCVAFGLLTFLFWQFEQALQPRGPRFVWLAGGVLVGYAAVDEYLQQFVGRQTDILDFAADALGIVLVLAALELRRRARARLAVRT